ncbi:3-oxoacid CoA-transferase [Ramlibacter sp.]|uniref:3-oxoacid CoA-transferase n=1 Tax=Ramlibacter sp. TaxID=1917967 RepID=UPI003D0DA9C5
MDKVVASPQAAIADIREGASIALAGFSVGHGFASSLITALKEKGTRGLTLVCNSLGGPGELRPVTLCESRQVSRLIASFSARPGQPTEAERQIAAGDIALELVPQGTLVERLRAGGAGIAGFYTRASAGTDVAAGKETREFNGETYVFETGLSVDYAFVRAQRADRAGNLQFRGGSISFNPSFAKAARIAIAEVDEIVEVGEIAPQDVGLAGIFITRVVKRTVEAEPIAALKKNRRGGDSFRTYNGKPALSRNDIARRAAHLIADGSYVNLGTGIPTLLANHVANRDVVLHAENGVLGYGPLEDEARFDRDHYNASGEFVSIRPGAAFFDSIESFEMARSGKLDAVVLGAYQVDEEANVANWSTPQMVGGGIGGAMDLVAGSTPLIVTMEHVDGRGEAKLVAKCTYPLTAARRVNFVVTDLALLERVDGRLRLQEIARGFTVEEVLAMTPMKVDVPDRVGVMQDAFGPDAA